MHRPVCLFAIVLTHQDKQRRAAASVLRAEMQLVDHGDGERGSGMEDAALARSVYFR